jgi:hypothetical protein
MHDVIFGGFTIHPWMWLWILPVGFVVVVAVLVILQLIQMWLAQANIETAYRTVFLLVLLAAAFFTLWGVVALVKFFWSHS